METINDSQNNQGSFIIYNIVKMIKLIKNSRFVYEDKKW